MTKMVPRRPSQLLSGAVSQQPRTAQQRYGAPLTRPRIHWLYPAFGALLEVSRPNLREGKGRKGQSLGEGTSLSTVLRARLTEGPRRG